jgi:spermidine synthase
MRLTRTADGGFEWNVRGATMSAWHPGRWMTGYAWDAQTAGCVLRPGCEPARVLVLGLGGGTVVGQLRQIWPGVRVTGVDLDERAAEVARVRLGDDVEVVTADAYEWLRRSRRTWDVVMDDVYAAGRDDVYRPVVPDAELIGRLAARLARGGVLVMNLVTGPGHETVRRGALRAFCGRFGAVAAVHPPKGYNQVLVGGQALGGCGALRGVAAVWRGRDRAWWSRLRCRRIQ